VDKDECCCEWVINAGEGDNDLIRLFDLLTPRVRVVNVEGGRSGWL
jgi:hypothetical protein